MFMSARLFVTWSMSGLLPLALGCGEKASHYTTTVEVIQVQRMGQDPKAPGMTDLELKFVDCPGDARKMIRGDKAFGVCGAKFKKGDKISAEVVLSYSTDRGGYRNELVRLEDCPVKLDPKEDANYEVVQECKDLMASGAVVGVHCDRTRSAELIAKCPWFKRK
jgi:hypothetical protein